MAASELRSLVVTLIKGSADYVKGDRTSHPLVRTRMPLWRRVGNAALSRWTGLLTGYTLRDAQCGYTVIRATTLGELPLDTLTRGYGYPNTMLMMLSTLGARVQEVTVTPIYENEASGLTPIRALRTHGTIMTRATLKALRSRRAYERWPFSS